MEKTLKNLLLLAAFIGSFAAILEAKGNDKIIYWGNKDRADALISDDSEDDDVKPGADESSDDSEDNDVKKPAALVTDESDDDSDEAQVPQRPTRDESVITESDESDDEPSQEEDYLEEQLEDENLLASLSIVGERTYKSGQIIQLQAQPEIFSYQWSGPGNFTATGPRISLAARTGAAGRYTVQAQSRAGTRSAQAEIVVLGADSASKQPAAIKVVSPVEPAKTKSAPAKSGGALLLIKTSNFRMQDDIISFTVNVTNMGKEKVTNVTVTDTLPLCLSLISAHGSGWTIITSDNELQAKLRSLEVNERKTIDISARVMYKPDAKVRNTATVASDTTLPCDSVSQLF